MACLSVAMLCKEQGITIAGVCGLYEVFVAQKVRSIRYQYIFISVIVFEQHNRVILKFLSLLRYLAEST